MAVGDKRKVAMEEDVSASLSKKANKYVVPISPLQSWEEIWSHAPGEYSWVQMERLPWQPLDTPSGGARVLLTISQVTEAPGDTKVIRLRYTDGSAMLREYIGEVSDAESKQGRLAPIATGTPPEEHPLPLAAGIENVANTQSSYRKRQNDETVVNICVVPSAQMPNGAHIATLPHGYRPKVALVRCAGNGVFLSIGTDGLIHANTMTGAAIPAGKWIGAGFDFVAQYGPIAQQSTPVRMLAPMSRMARSVTSKEPEKRLMCVVDAGGAYVEFVEVTVTYDEEWETLGALFTPYCYALKDGEALVDSDRPPHMRTHAGGDGLIAPMWDLGGKAWLESATAEEIAAWELEHPDTSKTPEAVRAQRDMLLSDTDKYAVLDAPISAETRAALYTYRQDLRDVPEQAGFPDAVVWPELPAITKAAPDPVDTAFDMMTGGEENA